MNYENLESENACNFKNRLRFCRIKEYTFARRISENACKMDKLEKLKKLNTVFTPNQPVNIRDFFYGRQDQLRKINTTLEDSGCHAVLYGDRGVGKTSLANCMKMLIDENLLGIKICYKVNCDQTDSFGDIWRKVFKKINLTLSKKGMGFIKNIEEKSVPLNDYIRQNEDLKPSEVIDVINGFEPCLFIFDEFENAKNQNVREKFSYLIKALSDEYPNITILLVGIAENIHGLIHDHKSLERCLRQIQLPHMSTAELEDIIDKGFEALELTITDESKQFLIDFSQGFPYYVHLLCKSVADVAIRYEESNIDEKHLRIAIDDAVEDAHETTRNCYESAIRIHRTSLISYEDVISACVLAINNQPDGLRTCDLRIPLQKITGKKVKEQNYRSHLDELTKINRGNILTRVGSANRYRYIFSSPLVKAFVYLKMYQSGKAK